MMNLIKSALGPILDGVLRLIPDKNEREKARENFELQMLAAMTGLVQGQLEVNKIEAQHTSIFVAGWRPAVGWICASALGWNYVLQPIIAWVAVVNGFDLADAPSLDTAELTTILLGMLGLGGMRSYEKRLGVERNTI